MKTPFFLFVALAISPSLPAAVVTYSSRPVFETATTNTNASWYSSLSTLGTLVRAENSGGAAINIDFNLDTIPDVVFGAGTFSFGLTFGGFYNGAASNTLIHTGTYAGGVGTLPLTGLVPGQAYQLQMLFADARNLGAGNSPRTVRLNGQNMGIYNFDNTQDFNMDGVTGGAGPGGASDYGYRSVLGTFIADATTQNITIETFNANGSSAGPQLNAFQLRAVPEPGRSLLLMASMSFFFARRRRN